MSEENNYAAEYSSGGSSRQRKKKQTPGDTIANAINRMADSMDNAAAAITRNGEAPRVNMTQIYEALAQLPDLQNLELAKAMDLLGASQLKFDMFMPLPNHMRTMWLHLQFYDL
ncbi:hypothetical protein KSP39_PZI023479 [Platanthera zijinensis]|uniref:Uncharacterized protein n=1 Tax=Platanthera zijinensis TaxID=2320716 RepID=A0AAP0ASU4_9ASPA